MKRKLLTILRDFLRDPPRHVAEHFDMETWGDGGDDDMHQCGTAACALGWATTIPEIRKAGLRFLFEEPVLVKRGKIVDYGFGAAMQVFDIDMDQAHHIFSCLQPSGVLHGRVGAAAAAARIDEVLKGEVA
jgi:hypothetical protein